MNFFEETLQYYGLTLDWVKAIIADNTATNLRAARLRNKPHVGCNNHKLNLDIELMVSGDNQLSQAIDCIHETMKAAKQKLKNSALLRNLTVLKPKMHNKTRWSGKYSSSYLE
jgi:hypothetical protein